MCGSENNFEPLRSRPMLSSNPYLKTCPPMQTRPTPPPRALTINLHPSCCSTVSRLPYDQNTPCMATNWDLLWIGHCGMRIPSNSIPNGERIPKGHVIKHHDSTVAQRQYHYVVSSTDDLKDYDDHTRVVTHVQDGICSLAYAVTQSGARKLLRSVGLFEVNSVYDIMLRQYCDGSHVRGYHNCLTVMPSLFHHHRPLGPLGAESDITPHVEGYNTNARTDNIRWSTRMNWDVLLDGRTDFVDGYPDKEQT